MPGWMKPSKTLKTQGDRQMDRMVADRQEGKSGRAIAEKARRQGRYSPTGTALGVGLAEPRIFAPTSPEQMGKSATRRYGAGKKVIEKGARP